MSFRVEFAAGSGQSFHEMPTEAREAFISRAVELAEAPWDGATVLRPGTDPSSRETCFGDHGIVYFHVDEVAGVIRFFRIVWAG